MRQIPPNVVAHFLASRASTEPSGGAITSGICAVCCASVGGASFDLFPPLAALTWLRSTKKLLRGSASPSVVAAAEISTLRPRKRGLIFVTSLKRLLAFDASEPSVKRTWRPRSAFLPPRTRETPRGRSTVTAMPLAGARPPLRTSTVYSTVWPLRRARRRSPIFSRRLGDEPACACADPPPAPPPPVP